MVSFDVCVDCKKMDDELGGYDLKMSVDNPKESDDPFESAMAVVIYTAALKEAERVSKVLKDGSEEDIKNVLKEASRYLDDFNDRKVKDEGK